MAATITPAVSLSADAVPVATAVALDAKLSTSFSTAGDVGTLAVSGLQLTCGARSLTATASVAGGVVSFSTSALPDGAACVLKGKLNGNGTGLPSAGFEYSFATAAISYTRYDLMVTVNSLKATIGLVEKGTAGYTLTAFANKTGYDIVALCALPYVGNDVWIHADGVARFSCVTPNAGNLRRTFKMRAKGELGPEDTNALPPEVVLRDVQWTGGISPSPTNVRGFGDYLKLGADELFVTSVGMKLAVTSDNFATSNIVSDDFVKFLARVAH